MPGHLPQALVKERAFKLREQSKVIKEAYIKKQFGKDFDVLWENSTDSAGRRIGRTPNYLEVVAPASMKRTSQHNKSYDYQRFYRKR